MVGARRTNRRLEEVLVLLDPLGEIDGWGQHLWIDVRLLLTVSGRVW